MMKQENGTYSCVARAEIRMIDFQKSETAAGHDKLAISLYDLLRN